MEELYEKYFILNSKQANNIINPNLTFRFNGHHINRIVITLGCLSIFLSIYFKKIYYIFFLGIFITTIIINKLSIYTVKFDTQNIIIENYFRKHIIYYKNGIKIYITKEENCNFRRRNILKQLTNFLQPYETNNKYSLILQRNYDVFVLATVVNDDKVEHITQFIDNFYFDENIQNEQYNIPLKK